MKKKADAAKQTCKHIWTRWGMTGGFARGKAIVLERCSQCKEERQRKATAQECAELRSDARRERLHSRELHRAWYPAQRLLERHRATDQDSKLKLSAAFERLRAKFPDSIRYARVDDAFFTSSDIWFFLHKCEDKSVGLTYWGTTVVYISQCDASPPVEFFCYPGHMRGLLAVAQEIDALERKLNSHD